MRRLALVVLCLSVAVAALAAPGLGAQPGDGSEAAAPHPKGLKSRQRGPGAPAASNVSRQDLLSPYSAMQRKVMGPPRELAEEQPCAEEGVQSNATSWKADPSLAPKQKGDDSPVQFKVGGEKVVDPVTGKVLTNKSDPAGAANRLKDLDVKGAADKLGGKAGVHVDVLKF